MESINGSRITFKDIFFFRDQEIIQQRITLEDIKGEEAKDSG
jgi:hypothetical protein